MEKSFYVCRVFQNQLNFPRFCFCNENLRYSNLRVQLQKPTSDKYLRPTRFQYSINWNPKYLSKLIYRYFNLDLQLVYYQHGCNFHHRIGNIYSESMQMLLPEGALWNIKRALTGILEFQSRELAACQFKQIKLIENLLNNLIRFAVFQHRSNKNEARRLKRSFK